MEERRQTRRFEPELESARQARHFVHTVLQAWGVPEDSGDLLTSELATNAVLHARSCFEVTVSASGGRIRIVVADQNPRLPHLEDVPPEALSGHGLQLVEALSPAWGVERRPEGKAVWFDLLSDQAINPHR